MSITASGGEIIVEFEVNSVTGSPGIGGHLLKISLNYVMPARKKELIFQNTIAKIFIGKDKVYLGTAFPEQPKTFKATTHQQRGGLLYEVLLSKDTIEEIEKIRSGDDLEFTIEVLGEYIDEFNQICTSDRISYRANQKEWINSLKSMDFKGGLVFELPMDINPSEDVKSALIAIDKAKKHLYYGNYEDVVAKCRISLEKIVFEWKSKSKINESFNKNRKEMTKEQRFFNAVKQIMHITHLAHHPDENSDYVPFTRSEAVFVLGATIAAISSYTENKAKELIELENA